MKNLIRVISRLFFITLFISSTNTKLNAEPKEIQINNQDPFTFHQIILNPQNQEQDIGSTMTKRFVKPITGNLQSLIALQKTFITQTKKNLPNKTIHNKKGYAYIQKVPINPKGKILIHGDMHGNYGSMQTMLAEAIKQKWVNEDLSIPGNTYLLGLGDYIDHGTNGLKIIILLMLLKLKNPNKVFFLKGNHEDISLSKRIHGFAEELQKNFKLTKDQVDHYLSTWQSCFDLFPEMLILDWQNTDNTHTYIPCVHGALESQETIANQPDLLTCFENNCIKIKDLLQNPTQNKTWINLKYAPYFSEGNVYAWDEKDQQDKFKSPYTWFDITEENAPHTTKGKRGKSSKILGRQDIENYLRKAFPEKSFIPALLKGHRQENRPLFQTKEHPGIARLLDGLAWTLDYTPEHKATTDTWLMLQKPIEIDKKIDATLIRFPNKPPKKPKANKNQLYYF